MNRRAFLCGLTLGTFFAPLVVEAIEGGLEEFLVIHHENLERNPAGAASFLTRTLPF